MKLWSKKSRERFPVEAVTERGREGPCNVLFLDADPGNITV